MYFLSNQLLCIESSFVITCVCRAPLLEIVDWTKSKMSAWKLFFLLLSLFELLTLDDWHPAICFVIWIHFLHWCLKCLYVFLLLLCARTCKISFCIETPSMKKKNILFFSKTLIPRKTSNSKTKVSRPDLINKGRGIKIWIYTGRHSKMVRISCFFHYVYIHIALYTNSWSEPFWRDGLYFHSLPFTSLQIPTSKS